MSDLSIGSLSLKISENGAQASAGIDKITQSLSKLKASSTGFNSLNKLVNNIESIVQAGSKINAMGDISAKMNSFVQGINSLSGLQPVKLTTTKNAINAVAGIADTIKNIAPVDTGKFTTIAEALKPFETIGKVSVGGILNQIKKFPEIAKELEKVDMTRFATSISNVATVLKPLASEMDKVGRGFGAFPSKLQKIITNNDKLYQSNQKVGKSYNVLGGIFNSMTAKTTLFYFTARKLGSIVSGWIAQSNNFVENLNLFQVAMGETAQSALDYANTVSSALGIDTSEFIRYQGIFKSITSGFGMVSSSADLISKNLTQLTYDLSSFYNIGIEESAQKLQSGISGELEPLRRLGFALDQVTLQQIANELGIKKRLTAMTQAEKAELRYYTIMKQGKNVLNDMARTIMTPTNAMRVLGQQIVQLQRALGNLFIPILIKVIPYVQAFVKILTEAAQSLASMMGFELPKINYDNVGSGLSSVTDEAESASGAVKELKRSLSSIDQLNIISSNKDNNNATAVNGSLGSDGSGLGLELPEYDFLDGLAKGTDEIYQNMKRFLFTDLPKWIKNVTPLFATLAGIIGTIWAVEKVKSVYALIKNTAVVSGAIKVWNAFADGFALLNVRGANFFNSFTGGLRNIGYGMTTFQKLIGGLAGVAIQFTVVKNSINSAVMGTKSWNESLGVIIATTTLVGIAMYAMLGPIGIFLTAVGGLTGAVLGYTEAQAELQREMANSTVFDGMGVSLDDLTIGFNSLINEVNDSNSAVKELFETYDDNKDKFKQNADDVRNLLIQYETLGISAKTELVPQIKQAMENIYLATKDNMGLATDIIVNQFRSAFTETAKQLGIDVDNMISSMYLLQAQGDKELAKLNQKANELVDKISNLDPNSKAFAEAKTELDDLMNKFSQMNATVSESEIKFNEYINAIDFSKVDLSSKDDLTIFLNDLTNRGKEALSGIEEVQTKSLSTLKEQMNNFKALGLDKTWDKLYGSGAFEKLFDDAEKVIKENYNNKKGEIETQLSSVFGAIQTTISENIKTAQSKAEPSLSEQWYGFLGSFLGGDKNKIAKNNADKRVEEQFGDIQKTFNENAKKLSITPNPELGKQLLEGLKIGYNSNKTATTDYIKKDLSSWSANNPFYMTTKSKSISETDLSQTKTKGQNYMNELGPINAKTSVSKFPNNLLVDFKNNAEKYFATNPIGIKVELKNGTLSGFTTDQIKDFRQYATGGFPETGEMFIAREAGPEMVGTIGGSTAVANNSQIVEGIEGGVYRGVLSALGQGNSEQQVVVNIYQENVKTGTFDNRKAQRTNGKYSFRTN